MYYPYFRGKQYELITVRENAELLAKHHFVPIIEPVKDALGGLKRALDAIAAVEGEAVLIVNPGCGDLAQDGSSIATLLEESLDTHPSVLLGILLTEGAELEDVVNLLEAHPHRGAAFIHAGFTRAAALVDALGGKERDERHIFVEESCGKLYRKHFRARGKRILLRDGFHRRRNRDHPVVEFFSDLHATFREEGMDGFGDFLVVGDDYSETGGPAYAVAIHITYIDYHRDQEMYVYHFKSDRQDTPTDPAGKFAEAVTKLAREAGRDGTDLLMTEAIRELLQFQGRGHFPGLGYVKKLSMQHHLETLANYFPQHPRR